MRNVIASKVSFRACVALGMVVLLSTFVYAGCQSRTEEEPPEELAQSRTEYESSEELAEALGCSSDYSKDDFNPVAKESGDCTLGDETLKLTVFESQEDIPNWKETVSRAHDAFGIEGHHVVGNKWIVSTESRQVAERVSDELGGDIETSQ